MSKTVFVVIASTGEYDEYRQMIAGCFLTRHQAEDCIKFIKGLHAENGWEFKEIQNKDVYGKPWIKTRYQWIRDAVELEHRDKMDAYLSSIGLSDYVGHSDHNGYEIEEINIVDSLPSCMPRFTPCGDIMVPR